MKVVVLGERFTFTLNEVGVLFIREFMPDVIRDEVDIEASHADELLRAKDLPSHAVFFEVIEVN